MRWTRVVRATEPEAELQEIVKCGTFEPLVRSCCIGVDPSLIGTGLAVLMDGELKLAAAWTDRKALQHAHPKTLSWFKMRERAKGGGEADRLHRISLIAGWVCGHVVLACNVASRVCLAIEGYAMSKRSTGSSDIHELCGEIKLWCWSRGVDLRVYDPLTVKLAATGKGNAEKEHMVVTAAHHYPSLKKELARLLEEHEETAGNVADAVMIAHLLHTEVELKAGRLNLERLPDHVRRVMLRTTKSAPEALVSREFLIKEAAAPPEPVFATASLA